MEIGAAKRVCSKCGNEITQDNGNNILGLPIAQAIVCWGCQSQRARALCFMPKPIFISSPKETSGGL